MAIDSIKDNGCLNDWVFSGHLSRCKHKGHAVDAVFRQILRFLLFSGTAAMVNLGAGYLLYQILGFSQGWLYGMSVALAFLAGMVVSFGLNRRYTFARSGRRIRDEMRTFLVVSLGGLLLTVGLASLFRSLLLPWLLEFVSGGGEPNARLNLDMLAHVGAVGLVAGYSFVAHKSLSFGKGLRRGLASVVKE